MELVEEWKDIVIIKNGIQYDYTGLYQISNFGRVKSLDYNHTKTHKILKLGNSHEYKRIGLWKDGEKNYFVVHRLVATAFIPNPQNLPEVNHKDENPKNNRVDNLEWCSKQYNMTYGTRIDRTSQKTTGQKRTQEQRQKMRENHADYAGSKNPRAKKVVCIETGEIFPTAKEASEWCKGNVKSHCQGRTKSAGKHPITGEKLHWSYLDEVE